VLAPTLGERVLRQPWPGNVRELANACELAIETAAGAARLEVEHWPATPFVPGPTGVGLHAETTALEGRRLREALARTHGNKTQAARALGLSRQGFLQKLRRHGLGGCATLDDDRGAD
jgi:transcriptional regulator of acetoin/glycerol metabolism